MASHPRRRGVPQASAEEVEAEEEMQEVRGGHAIGEQPEGKTRAAKGDHV